MDTVLAGDQAAGPGFRSVVRRIGQSKSRESLGHAPRDGGVQGLAVEGREGAEGGIAQRHRFLYDGVEHGA